MEIAKLTKLFMSVQLGALVEQNAWFRDKVISQRQVLNKLSVELTALRKLKVRAEELERENSALRHQLASFSNPNDGAQDCRYKLDQRSVASDASGAHHKRRATSPASREYEVTPRLAPQNLPAGPQQRRPAPPPPPTRLSLSPAHNAKVVTKLQTSRQNHLIAESASNRAASSRAEHRQPLQTTSFLQQQQPSGSLLRPSSSASSRSRNQNSLGGAGTDFSFLQGTTAPQYRQQQDRSSNFQSRNGITPMPFPHSNSNPNRSFTVNPRGNPDPRGQQLQNFQQTPPTPQRHQFHPTGPQQQQSQTFSRTGTPKPNLGQFRFRGPG